MDDVRSEIVKSIPPAGVSILSCAGIPLSEWVYIVTLIYLLIQIGWLIAKIYWKCCNRGD